MKVELELSNYATKAYLKNAIDVNTLKFAKKIDLESLKSEVDKLDIDKLEKVQNGLNSLKSKVDKLGVDKLVLVFVDLSKPIDVLKNDVVKQDVMYMNIIEYNVKTKDIEDKIPDITNLAAYTTLNAKTKDVKNESLVLLTQLIILLLLLLKIKYLITVNILLLKNLIS